MHKQLLLILMFILLSPMVGANIGRVSYEDYVLWSDKEKEDYHIKVMELVVNLEAQYKRETALHGFSESRYRRYVQILRTLQSHLLIPNAYADAAVTRDSKATVPTKKTRPAVASQPSWRQIADVFGVLSKRDIRNPKENVLGTCLYAGWISRAKKNAKGEVVCSHPDFIGGTGPNRVITLENQHYPAPKPGSLCDVKKNDMSYVQCNPVIFGYKKVEAGKPRGDLFCVKVDDLGENAAFKCMQESLKEKAEDADSKEARLEDLKRRYLEHKPAFDNVFEFTYKTCVCSVPGNNLFNTDYQDYMRPGSRDRRETDRYRTCFGLMRMMGEVKNVCDLPGDKGVFKAFEDFLKNKNSTNISGKEADDYYDQFIRSELKKSPEAVQTYNHLCGENLKVEKPQMVISTAETPTAETPTVVTPTVETPTTETPTVVTPTTETPTTETPTAETPTAETPTAETPTVVTPPIVPTPSQQKEYTCTAKCGDVSFSPDKSEENNNGKFSCDWEVSEKDDSNNKHKGSSVAGWPQSKEEKILKLKHTDFGSEGLSCPIEWEKESERSARETDPAAPSISVTVTDRGEKTYKIKAVIENDEGWTFSWRNEDVPAALESLLQSERPGNAYRPIPGVASVADGDGPSADATSAKEAREVRRKRLQAPYKVCGVLTKNSQPEKKACVTVQSLVKKKDEKPKSSGVQMGPAGPMPPPIQMRGAADTSAVGIK
jgi:hypothetical protein